MKNEYYLLFCVKDGEEEFVGLFQGKPKLYATLIEAIHTCFFCYGSRENRPYEQIRELRAAKRENISLEELNSKLTFCEVRLPADETAIDEYRNVVNIFFDGGPLMNKCRQEIVAAIEEQKKAWRAAHRPEK